MSYVIDTNIVIHKVRDSLIWEKVNKQYFNNQWKERIAVSVVTLAEAKVFGKRNNWGRKRSRNLAHFLEHIGRIPINDDVIESYVQIDLYSQN